MSTLDNDDAIILQQDNDENNDNDNNAGLTISSISTITDSDFENVDLALHGAVLIFNELLRDEDTSQWYFLEKVHENYFATTDKWNEYLQKISPNEPIDLHDIRKQIINGYYNKDDEQKLLNDMGSVFTNAMVRYNDEDDDDEDEDDTSMYDEAQRLLDKFQTLCSEMEKEKEEEQKSIVEITHEALVECEDSKDVEVEDGDIIIPSSEDVFEIEDYYCASPWERLISEIEKQLQAWSLHNGSEQCAVEYKQQMKNSVLSTNITISNSTYNYILEYHDYTEYIEPLKKYDILFLFKLLLSL